MSGKISVVEAIVVEGRYDKNTVSQVVDASVIAVDGFGIFRDTEMLAMLRRLARTQGIIILTDSDGAGFVIRNHLKGTITDGRVLHAYIPDIYGKEKRKRIAGREGKLGVEGMDRQTLIEVLRRAGATIVEETAKPSANTQLLTRADLLAHGLIGAGSTVRRAALLRKLHLPEHLSTNALLTVLNENLSEAERQEIGLFQKL